MQLIVLCYINVWLHVATNYKVIFRPLEQLQKYTVLYIQCYRGSVQGLLELFGEVKLGQKAW